MRLAVARVLAFAVLGWPLGVAAHAGEESSASLGAELDFGNRARWKRNLRSALNKNHRKADGYEVIGEMDNGLPARVRRWYVKDPARRTTVSITLTVLALETEGRVTDATALDAEIEAILDSIEIIPRN